MGRLRIDRIAGPAAPLRDGRGALLAARCHVASTPLARAVGLLGTPDLGRDEALWLAPCSAVHTLGLRAGIGVAFLDSAGMVLRVDDPLPRGRFARAPGARAVVECRAGILTGVAPGDRLLRETEIPLVAELLSRPRG